MHEPELRLSEDPLGAAYAIVALGPYKVRFLKFTDFLQVEVDVWLDMLRKLSPQQVDTPLSPLLGKDLIFKRLTRSALPRTGKPDCASTMLSGSFTSNMMPHHTFMLHST